MKLSTKFGILSNFNEMVFIRLVRRDDVTTLSYGPCRFWRLETTKVFHASESFLTEVVHETDHELRSCNTSLVRDVVKQQDREDQVQPTRAKKGHVRHSHIVKLPAGTTGDIFVIQSFSVCPTVTDMCLVHIACSMS